MSLGFSIALAALFTKLASGDDPRYCGGIAFNPSEYSCDRNIICPNIDGEPSYSCGNAGCYLPEDYTCNNSHLTPLQRINSTYTLFPAFVDPDEATRSYQIAACGYEFLMAKDTSSCTYCPSLNGLNCSQFPNPTPLVMARSNLWVNVPGGQQVYVDTTPGTGNGAVGYTQAHSTDSQIGAIPGLGVDSTNHLIYSGPRALQYPTPWLACLAKRGGSTKPFFKIYARLQNVTLSSDCKPIQLGAKAWPSSRFGAWQYV